MKKWLYILIPLAIALALRLYPTVTSGMPFSTDAWPLIKNAELLSQNTPVPLSSGVFDGYNNYWPANQVFGVVLAQITGLPVITAMALGIPIVAALAIPIFYLIVKKLTGNSGIALVASGLLAAAFPYALFTAGVTKETFASPIYLCVILLFLLKHDWKTTVLFSVVSLTLVLSHHLTAFMAIVIIASVSAALVISKRSSGAEMNSNRANFLLLAILVTITALYFGLYAWPILTATITPSEILSVAAYQTFMIAIALYVVLKPNSKQSRWRTIGRISLGLLLVSAFIMIVAATPAMVSAGAPFMPTSYLLYALPFAIAVPTAIIALGELHKKHSSLLLPFFWLLSIVGFSAFAVLGNSANGVGFAYRSLNFILPPLIILVALGVYKLYTMPKHVNNWRLTKVIAALVVVSMATVSIYSVYATTDLQEPYLGYFWRYEPSEFHASDWLSNFADSQAVAGDFKVYYLMSGYFNQSVSVLDGLHYLAGNGSAPQMLYIYNQMYRNGYVLQQGSPVSLPDNWTDKLAGYNCIYTNLEVTINAKR